MFQPENCNLRQVGSSLRMSMPGRREEQGAKSEEQRAECEGFKVSLNFNIALGAYYTKQFSINFFIEHQIDILL